MLQFQYERVKDPLFYAEGRAAPHSDHAYYPSWEAAEAGESSFVQSLDGVWKFHYASNYAQTIAGFETPSYDCGPWDDIRVPGHIQTQGYDAPHYTNTAYPWDGHEQVTPGEIPKRFNPVASYARSFAVPEAWSEQPVFVCFEGAESGLAVWCNGAYVGYSADSFTPHAFELTPYLKAGENKLAVQVFKWTAASWCEDQDFFRFSGLYRSVYLYTEPKVHLRDLRVDTVLTDDFVSAEVRVALCASAKGVARVSLQDGETVLAQASVPLKAGTLPRNGLEASQNGTQDTAQVSLPLEKPHLWSAEQPFLYTLRIAVETPEGGISECVVQKVGVRRFEIRDSLMLLNGKRIVFKGVNRHEFSALGGRCVTREETLKDVVTMKRNNINAVRTCHYPDISYLYELCDEYGLYMIDECNLESHGTWDLVARQVPGAMELLLPDDKPQWVPPLLDRINNLYQRDKNHAAVLIWSCGNESFGGKDILQMSNLLRKLDGTRPVHYEGVHWDPRYRETSDIESQMYTPAAEVAAYLQKDRSKPFICCEYAHAMGNSCGALYKYTDLAYTEPLYQGGFIWDYIDQSMTQTDRYGVSYQGYGGDFGDRPCDYDFCGNGIVYAEHRDASPKMQEVKFCYQEIEAQVSPEKVLICNRSLFTATSAYVCRVRLERGGKLLEEAELPTDVAPLSEQTYALPFQKRTAPGEYAVTVSFCLRADTLWAKAGHEVAFGQCVYQNEAPAVRCKKPLIIVPGWQNVGARGDSFEVMFSGAFMGLSSYRYAGRQLLRSIPRPNFWRAPTDNDTANAMPARYGQWKLASQYSSRRNYDDGAFLPPDVQQGDGCLTVTYTHRLPTQPEAFCTLSYTVTGDGTVETTLHYDPVAGLSELPEFGVLLDTFPELSHLRWYGLGPEETYWDRKHGAKLGIYETTAQQSMAKYLVPQECGNRSGVRWAELTDARGHGLRFEGEEMNLSALPYSPYELENATHPNELPPVYHTVVRASLAQMGVAGDNAWGARTHPEFLIPSEQPLTFTFRMRGL